MAPHDEYLRQVNLGAAIHGLGLLLAPLLLPGLFGIVECLDNSMLSMLGAIVYTLATFARVLAVVVHGLVGPASHSASSG